MQPKTIKQLNALNRQFYDKTAEYFNDSRQFYWAGWEELLPSLIEQFSHQDTITVLDLGCGNGRFGSFLCEELPIQIEYFGIDANAKLLAAAEKRFADAPTACQFKTTQQDLIAATLNHNLLTNINSNSQDLVAMFGLWHHLPSRSLRQTILNKIASILKPTGLLVFTAWKFYEYERFKQKIVAPKTANIYTNDLEENDYILDWQRGTTAYRYCHYSTDDELENTLNAVPNLKLNTTFRADGPKNNSNQYLIVEKR